MGRRGPPPDPTWLQNVKGNPSKRATNRAEPKPKMVAFQEPPAYFNDEHRRVWFLLCHELNHMEILTSADSFSMERYVVFLMRWRECRAYLETNFQGRFSYPVRGEGTPEVRNSSGEIVRPAVLGPIKYFKPVPEVRTLQELSQHLLHMEDRFGLSPSARSRIMVQDPENPNPPGGGEVSDGDDFSDLDA